MKAKLAAHQIEGFEHCKYFIDHKVGARQLICAPTGAGKTVLFGAVCDYAAEQNKLILILTDRETLLKQTGKSVSNFFDHPVTYITAKQKQPPELITIQGERINIMIGMVETVYKRLEKRQEYDRLFRAVKLVIIDEAHEMRFSKIINHEAFGRANILGFTATPIYSNKKRAMHEHYHSLKVLASEEELINEGYLVQPKTISFLQEPEELEIKNGEYSDQSIIMRQKQVMPTHKIVEIYLRECKRFLDFIQEANPPVFVEEYAHIKHLKAIFFGVNSNHVLEIHEAFKAAGIRSNYILSNTSIQTKKERDQAEEDFRNNQFEVLINCQITTKGYDAPDVLIIGKVYRTVSIAKDNQVGGRGSRPNVKNLHLLKTPEERRNAIAKSRKPYFVVLDYLGNHNEHGRWQVEKPWLEWFRKEPSNKTGEPAMKECPECKNLCYLSAKVCKHDILNPETDEVKECGYIFPERDGETVYSNLHEIDQNPFKDLSPDQLIGYSVAELSNAYKAKDLDFKTALKAVRMKGDLHLWEFALIQGYQNPAKWLSKRYNFSKTQINEIETKYTTHRKKILWRDIQHHFRDHPFQKAEIAKVIATINNQQQSGENWEKIEGLIRSNYI